MEIRQTSIGGQIDAIRELPRIKLPPSPCTYLPAETVCQECRVVFEINPEAYHELLQRGWRRFGGVFFRPACPQCSKCTGIRVLVPEFKPNKSQRRALKLNQDVQLVVGPASVSAEHLRLFNAYHSFMQGERNWAAHSFNEIQYERQFLHGRWEFAKEFLYYDAGKLIGVGLVDVLPDAISSVYFYHDPALRARSLGVYSMLKELEYAKARPVKYQYLGFWLAECRSLAYKSQYHPHEFLAGYPADEAEPVWERPD